MAALWSWPPAVSIFSPSDHQQYIPTQLGQNAESLMWAAPFNTYLGDAFANILAYGALYAMVRHTVGQTMATPYLTASMNGRAPDTTVTNNGFNIYQGYSDKSYDTVWVEAPQSYYWPDTPFGMAAFGVVLQKPPLEDRKKLSLIQLTDFSRFAYDALAAGLTSAHFRALGSPAGYILLVQMDLTAGAEKLMGVKFTVATGTFGSPITLMTFTNNPWVMQDPVDMGGGHFHLGNGNWVINVDLTGATPVVTQLINPTTHPGLTIGEPVHPKRALKLAGGIIASTWYSEYGGENKLRTIRSASTDRLSYTIQSTTMTLADEFGISRYSLLLENDPGTGHAAVTYIYRKMDVYTDVITVKGDYMELSGTQPATKTLDPTTVIGSWKSNYPTDFIYADRIGSALAGAEAPTLSLIVAAYGGGSASTQHCSWFCYNEPTTYIVTLPIPITTISVQASGYRESSRSVTFGSPATMVAKITTVLGYAAKYNWNIAFSSEKTTGADIDTRNTFNFTADAQKATLYTKSFTQNWLNMGTTWMDEFTRLVNEDRALIGLPPYKIAGADGQFLKKLDIAQIHAQNVADAQYMAHDDARYPDGWETLYERIARIPAASGSENIQAAYVQYLDNFEYEGYETPLGAFTSWKNSPQHYANLRRDWGASADKMYLYMGLAESTTISLAGFPSQYPSRVLVLCNVFALLEENMIERNISFYWDNTGGIISNFPFAWSNDSYEHVSLRHTSGYSLRVSAEMSVDYGCRAGAEHSSPITYTTLVSMEVAYSGTTPVGPAEHTSSYQIKDTVSLATEHLGLWGLTVGGLLSSPYEGMVRTTVHVESAYGDQIRVLKQSESAYNISNSNPASAVHSVGYALDDYASQSVANNVVTVTHAGGTMRVSDGVISSASGDLWYSFEFTVEDINDFSQIVEDSEIAVDFCGESYLFVVSSKSIDRNGPAQFSMRVSAVSPAARADSPYAPERAYTQTGGKLASAIVDELIEINFNYEVVDWLLPDGRMQASGATPLQIVSTLMEAIGAVVDATPDGTLRLRYVYPYPMNDLANAPLARVYTDAYDNLSARTRSVYRDGANSFRVREGEANFSDSLEWIEDEIQADPLYRTGVLKAYLSPYRTTVAIKHLGGAAYLRNHTEGYADEEQMVEFSGGTGSVSKPIDTLLSVEWVTASLGTPTFLPYSTTLNANTLSNDGYGLAKVSYRTRYISAEAGGVPYAVDSGEVGPYNAYAYFVLEDSNG